MICEFYQDVQINGILMARHSTYRHFMESARYKFELCIKKPVSNQQIYACSFLFVNYNLCCIFFRLFRFNYLKYHYIFRSF